MHQQNHSFKEIAQKISLSENTVRNQFTQISKTLRKNIKEKYLTPFHKLKNQS